VQQILTPNGYVDIDYVGVGNHVLAYDVITGAPIINTVERKEWLTPPDDETTFYVINGTWTLYQNQSIWRNADQVVHASDLEVGDMIYDGSDNPITIIDITETTGAGWWRFAISGDHSYIVDGITLHNASRYWVGGTANWDGTDGLKWSATSGGAGGASRPNSPDSVFFDVNSTGTCTISSGSTGPASLDCTGHTGSLSGSTNLTINGNVTLGSGGTYSGYTGTFTIQGNTNYSLTTNGNTSFGGTIMLNPSGGAVASLADDLTIAKGIIFRTSSTGTITTNSHNTSSTSLTVSNINTGALTVNGGTSTFTVTSSGTAFSITNDLIGTITINGTSTVKLTYSGATEVDIGNSSYSPTTTWNIWHAPGSGTNTLGVLGSMTVSDFKDDGTGTHNITQAAGSILTVTTFTVSGTPGHLITLNTDTPGSQATLSCASGVINSNYLNIQNSNATGGATWNAGANSTNGGNNSGWIFGSTPVVSAYMPIIDYAANLSQARRRGNVPT
jgi:hypothetical protein